MLRTPNTGENMLFHIFGTKKCEKERKTKKKKIKAKLSEEIMLFVFVPKH